MPHRGLQIRMALAGSVVFAIYALFALTLSPGIGALVVIVVLSIGFVGLQYVIGTRLPLWSVGAVDMAEERFPRVQESCERLADAMDIPPPRLMIADFGVPNAFTVGRKGAGVVVLSSELLYTLEFDEVEGVLAHELAHIQNRDVVVMVIGQSIASMIALSVQLLMAVVPKLNNALLRFIVGNVVHIFIMVFVLAIARYREYVADADAAAHVGGDPLIRALEGISEMIDRSPATVDRSVAALCIHASERGLAERLLATHPPVEKRIERLESL